MPRESPFAADTFGVRSGELVVRKDQIATTALDVEAASDTTERDGCALDMPAWPARPERGRPAGLTGPRGPPQQRVEFVALAGAPRIAATFLAQPQHGVTVIP
ncbi:Uncharacterised protein [Mycobacterium tuberculosis]|nr:Uncharacterised protein [Mycobacterium tuberculosis]CNN08168.1 Uncharacterised protein [Mycobacterium tuberculosis]